MGTLSRNPQTVYSAKQGQRFNSDTTLAVVTCATCGVTYAIPDSFDRSARRFHGDTSNGWKICCPFGHTWWYVGETDLERVERQRDNARDDRARLRSQLDQTQASLRGTKARAARTQKELRQTKERVAHGVCPCCNRSFVQLRRHMKRQHPEYVDAA